MSSTKPSSRSRTSPVDPVTAPITEAPAAYVRGQAIEVKIVQFGPLGASVTVNGGEAYGLVLQREIALLRDKRGSDVLVGDTIDAWVEKMRDDGRLNVSFRPVDTLRMKDTAEQIVEALEGSPSMSIPVGDKSSPEDIAAYFYGVTKSDFKKAIGMLYKQGIAKPGPFSTELIPEEDRRPSEGPPGAAAKTSPSTKAAAKVPVPAFSPIPASASNPVARKRKEEDKAVPLPQRLNSMRGDIKKTLFLGNLPLASCTEEDVLAAMATRIDTSKVKPPVRIALDAEAKPRGFAHVEFREEEDVEFAVRELKGLKIRERIVRLDYADPEKSKREAKEGGGKTEGEAEGLRGQSDLDDERPTAATLYVGNLSYKAGVKEVTEFLERKAGKGSVKSVRLATDQATGRKKGFAYVDFFVEDDAKVCFEELHEKDLLGRSVRIDDATRR